MQGRRKEYDNLTHITIYLPEKVDKALAYYAKIQKKSKSMVIRELLKERFGDKLAGTK